MIDVLHYIHAHLCETLSLEETARRFGYSKWRFCEAFKRYTGVTFTGYVRHLRMQNAVLAMQRGEKFVDVAMEYGYETQSGFNKAFLKEYGCMPGEYLAKQGRCAAEYLKRKEKRMQISDRCALLREDAVNVKSHSGPVTREWILNYYKGALETCDLPEDAAPVQVNARLIAGGAAGVARGAAAFIMDGELIVGHNYGMEEPCYWSAEQQRTVLEQDDTVTAGAVEAAAAQRRVFDARRVITFEQGDWGVVQQEDGSLKPIGAHRAHAQTQQEQAAANEMAAMGYNICANHTVLGYEQVVKLGFEGLLAHVESCAEKNGDTPFYENLRILCRAGCVLGEKYAAKARELAAGETEPVRKAELERIAAVCTQVPRRPARNFWEAVQSLWFAHMLNTWEDGINANSVGRLDQIFYPYYKAEIEAGTLTKEDAFELICCLWIKLYRDYDVQQSCVGGTHADGSSAVNELSWMMLDATEALDFVRCLSVRFSPRTDKEFMRRALEVVGHTQKGVPFFFNDDVMIPALEAAGIAHEDACNYTQIGCVETVIPGKSNPHAVTARINLLKALEYTLSNGSSMIFEGAQPGLCTGTPEELDTYEKLLQAVHKQLRWLLRTAVNMTLRSFPSAAATEPRPYKSLLTEGCAESGRDFNEQGALYDYYQTMLVGLPNLADSLTALRVLVYEQKRYTLEQVIDALKNNFPDEAMRLRFVNKAPKFGNDIAEVDVLAAQLMNFACDELAALSAEYGHAFHPQPFSYLWMLHHGTVTAASPDGRRAGEPLAYSVSPMQGRDFNGFTALINSLACLPTKKAPGTTSAIVEADPRLFTDQNIPYFVDVLLGGAEKGLSNVQFNIVSADTLRDAQLHPEKHRNLAVRVSGFSQKFNLLNKDLQDHIISRTKHECM